MPLRPLEAVGVMNLLAFGGWWALSMTKYYSGRTHPEDDEDARAGPRHLSQSEAGSGWNFLVALVAFKSSLIESFEVAIKVVGLRAAPPSRYPPGNFSGRRLHAAIGLRISSFGNELAVFDELAEVVAHRARARPREFLELGAGDRSEPQGLEDALVRGFSLLFAVPGHGQE